MRYLVKFLIFLVLLYIVLSYYGLFSFSYGFCKSVNDINFDVLTIKNIKALEIGNGYYVIIQTSLHTYTGLIEGHDDLALTIISLLTNSNYDKISYAPLIICSILMLITIFFPKRKKEEIVSETPQHIYVDEDESKDSSTSNKKAPGVIGSTAGAILAIILLVLITIIIIVIVNNITKTHSSSNNGNDNENTYVPDTSVDNGDFSFNVVNDEITLISVYYTITPKVNIEFVKYRITIYDDDNTILYETIEEKRNLKSYSTYKYNVEVGLVNFFKVDKVMFSVIDGKKALN